MGVKTISRILKFTKIIYFIDGIKNYAVFKGRINRSGYWFFMLYWAIGYFLVIAIENSMGLNNIDFSNYSFSKYIPLLQYSKKVGLLTLLYRPITILPSLSADDVTLVESDFTADGILPSHLIRTCDPVC